MPTRCAATHRRVCSRRYEPTLPFSTYLFSVIAGPYRAAHDVYGEIPLAIYTRESLFEHLDADEIFLVTKQGLAWYEEFFDRSWVLPNIERR